MARTVIKWTSLLLYIAVILVIDALIEEMGSSEQYLRRSLSVKANKKKSKTSPGGNSRKATKTDDDDASSEEEEEKEGGAEPKEKRNATSKNDDDDDDGGDDDDSIETAEEESTDTTAANNDDDDETQNKEARWEDKTVEKGSGYDSDSSTGRETKGEKPAEVPEIIKVDNDDDDDEDEEEDDDKPATKPETVQVDNDDDEEEEEEEDEKEEVKITTVESNEKAEDVNIDEDDDEDEEDDEEEKASGSASTSEDDNDDDDDDEVEEGEDEDEDKDGEEKNGELSPEDLKKQKQDLANQMKYSLPPAATDWCLEPQSDPLPNPCGDRDVINVVPFVDGLTSGLRDVLLGAITSLEQDRCFYIDENESQLVKRNDADEQLKSILRRYFEPIGLAQDDEAIKKAKKTKVLGREKVWNSQKDNYQKRRTLGSTTTLSSLGYEEMDGHALKRNILRRMWRLVGVVRDMTCNRLASFGLKDDFIAIEVMRKTTKDFEPPPVAQYLYAITQAVKNKFDGKMGKVFVATDDCDVLVEFRQKRPHWDFVSECDRIDQDEDDSWMDLSSIADWTMEETDAHFQKFFVELYAMIIAKYFIGPPQSAISWWVYFARGQGNNFFELVYDVGTPLGQRIVVDKW